MKNAKPLDWGPHVFMPAIREAEKRHVQSLSDDVLGLIRAMGPIEIHAVNEEDEILADIATEAVNRYLRNVR